MPPQLNARFQAIGRSIAALTLGQKVIAVIGIAVLALGGTAFGKWVATPTYVPAFSSLAASDANAISDELTKDNIKNKVDSSGTAILVPQADVATARLKAAGAGLPSSTKSGYSLLDTEGVTSSQFQQKVTYQRAVEGELAKTIEGIDGVNAAVVHLAIPEETVFTDRVEPPKAAVLVDTAGGASLSDSQVQAIIHLVSSSVPNMDADQVTVSDAKGTLLSAAGQGVTSGSGTSDAATTAYEQNTAASIQKMLDRVLGSGNAIASVNAVLNYDKTQKTSETFSSTQGALPLSSATTKETYTGTGAATAGGTLGLDTATGTTSGTTTTTGNGNGYVKESDTSNNAVNKVTEQVTAAPGSVTRQSVAVVVDSAAVAKAGLPQLQQMVSAAAGIDAVRGDTLSVTQATFDDSAAKAAKSELTAAKAANAAKAQQQLIKQGAIGGGVLIAFIILAIMWKKASKKVVREPVDLGELARLYPATGPVITPDGTMALTASSELVPAAPDPAALRRAEVGELVDQQPAEVADLLRGWLTETKKV